MSNKPLLVTRRSGSLGKRRVLITGATGLLGKALLEQPPQEVDVWGTYLPGTDFPPVSAACPIRPMDVRDPTQIAEVFDWAQPDAVIHAASIGSVDYAERHREETWAVNVGGTRNVCRLCLDFGARLVFISSNAVFDGRAPFYREDAPVSPVNYYGQVKVEGEQYVQSSGVAYAIVRPILMYGWPNPRERSNWVVTWVQKLSSAMPVQVVNDVYSKPLLALNCAEAIWAVVLRDKPDILHVAGADHLTLYDFALRTAEVFGLDAGLIEPVPSSLFSTIAQRPQDTSFDTGRMEQDLGVRPLGVVEGLVYMREHMPSWIEKVLGLDPCCLQTGRTTK